jgi:hypothetical protein
MPCSDGRGPDVELAYAKSEIKNLELLLEAACRMLVTVGQLSLIQSDKDLSFWWRLHKNDQAIRLEREHRKQLAEAAREKPFKDLTTEDKKILKEFGYL